MAHHFEHGVTFGNVSWHKLEENFPDDMPESEKIAIVMQAIGWQVIDGIVSVNGVVDKNYKACIRETDGRNLGIVEDTFRTYQNSEMMDWMKPFLDSGNFSLTSAMSLCEGRKVFIQAALRDGLRDIVPGDTIKAHIGIATGHGGKMRTRPMSTDTRIVCDNTLGFAIGESLSDVASTWVRHTKGAKKKLLDIREIYLSRMADFDAQVEVYRSMAKKPMNSKEFKEYCLDVFKPTKKAIETVKESLKLNRDIKMDDILLATENQLALSTDNLGLIKSTENQSVVKELLSRVSDAEWMETVDTLLPRFSSKLEELFENGSGAEFHRGTVWGAYNSVTEYIDHHRSKDAMTGMDASLFGAGVTIRDAAYQAATSRI